MIKGRMIIIGAPEAIARGMKHYIKIGYMRAIDKWHRKFRPKHFQRGAPTRYGYARRTDAYMRRKRRRGLGPLQWSGDFEKMTRRIAIAGTSRKGAGSMNVPWYVKNLAGKAGHPDMVDELTVTTRDEADKLSRELERTLQQQIDDLDDVEVFSFGGA